MKKIACLALVLGVFFGSQCFAQQAQNMSPEQAYLSRESAAKFDSLRSAAKSSFQGILLYPDDIRNSVLEVSQYPDLIVLLKNKEYVAKPQLDKYLSKMPQEAKNAVEKLNAYPDIIDILDKNIVVTSLLGEMVKEKKGEIVQVVKRMSDSVQQGHTKVVDAWTEKMQQDPKAIQELQAASEAYAKENNLPSPNKPQTAAQAEQGDNPYGYYVNESNTVIIQEMPSDEMMQYMLANQAMYVTLFAVAVNHHNMFYNDYYWHAYNDHYEDRWNEYQNNLNNISSGLNDLNTNIDENQAKRQEAKDGAAAKKDEVQARKEEAGTRREDATARKDAFQERGASAGTSDKTRMTLSPEQKAQISSRPANMDSGRSQYAQRGAPSSQQQISRASQYHSGSWEQGSGSRGGQSRGDSVRSSGGASSGAARPSGGGSRPSGGGGASRPSGGGRSR